MPYAITLAVLTGLAGCASLYVSWKKDNTIAGWSGWLMITASVWLWVLGQGIEYGLVAGLSLPALFVWLFIVNERKVQGGKAPHKPFGSWRWQGRKVLANTGHVLFLLLVLMLASTLITVALVHYLPVSEPTQMAAGIILVPLLWGGLAVWYGMAERKRGPLISTLVGALVSGIVLFVV